MRGALALAIVLSVAVAACSDNATPLAPVPTLSPAAWADAICASPAPLDINVLDPETDPRFNPEVAAAEQGDPAVAAQNRLEVALQDYRGVAAYLEALPAPAEVLAFHQALIDGHTKIADAIEANQDGIIGAESVDDLQASYAEFQRLDSDLTDQLRAASASLPQAVFDQIRATDGCAGRLRLEAASATP